MKFEGGGAFMIQFCEGGGGIRGGEGQIIQRTQLLLVPKVDRRPRRRRMRMRIRIWQGQKLEIRGI